MKRQLWLSIVILAASAPAVLAEDPVELQPERVTFKTADGVEVVGEYYAPKHGKKSHPAPCAILVHMFPSDKSSWRPLAPILHKKGFAVLAYDIRGAGESLRPKSKELRRKYSDRDGELFGSAWQDAAAAVKWMGEHGGCDVKRIVMIGASVGCSISIDYAGRNKDVLGVICLSPGTNYMELDSVKQIGKLGARPILLISPEAEREAADKLAKKDKSATVMIKPGDQSLHGTAMLGAEFGPELMKEIATFASEAVKPGETSAGK